MTNFYFKISNKDVDGYITKVKHLIDASSALSHEQIPHPDHVGIKVFFNNDEEKNAFVESLQNNIGLGMSEGY